MKVMGSTTRLSKTSRVPPEEAGVDYIDITWFVERLCDFVDKVLTHDVIVQMV